MVGRGDLPALCVGGVTPTVTTGVHRHFVAACAGTLDDDATLDVGSSSDLPRIPPSGDHSAGGERFNDVDDRER